MIRSAIIIGASSGIGRALAVELAKRGCRLGIASRRVELLKELAAMYPQVEIVRVMDLVETDQARAVFLAMLAEMAPVDAIFLSSGTGHVNPDLEWGPEAETIRVNSLGFAALAGAALAFFLRQGHGHLVGISSVAAVRGAGGAPAYGASKSFASSYMGALRLRALQAKLPVYVTDVRPGFVDTAMMKTDRPFWVATPERAARQILAAAGAKKRVVYVTRRWRLIAWLLWVLPDAVVAKME